jgi:hypothetical protein
MNSKLIELAEQRAALVAKAANQRKELAQALASWRGPLHVVDQGWTAARYLGSRPILLAGLAAFLISMHPWRLLKWLPPGWLAGRLARMALGSKGILRGL